MYLSIFYIILIAGLLGYIIFLHIQITKKNIFIETTVKRLSGIEKNGNMDEMMAFLLEIQRLSQYSSFFPDKLLEEKSIDFIFENDKEIRTYLHYTMEEADALSIINDGFKFAESFYKTAIPVTKDKLDIIMKHNSRKFFGEYLIIICIPNDIVNFYSMELEKAGISNLTFENILTSKPPLKNENADLVYQLSPQFIKGYVNHRTGYILKNQAYDPWHDSEAFMKNIDLLKNKPH